MKCPACESVGLAKRPTKNGVLVDQCPGCRGVWLDRGEILFFSRQPRKLDVRLAESTVSGRRDDRQCPCCNTAMDSCDFLNAGLEVEKCPECEGLWFDGGELKKAVQLDRQQFGLELFHFRIDFGLRHLQTPFSTARERPAAGCRTWPWCRPSTGQSRHRPTG